MNGRAGEGRDRRLRSRIFVALPSTLFRTPHSFSFAHATLLVCAANCAPSVVSWFARLPFALRSAQVISQHHISAQQAIIFPPVADNGTWRLTDTSSNGTTVDDVMVGKNKQVELRDNCRIGFSTRAYPRAMFALGPAPASLAPPSAKRKRTGDTAATGSAPPSVARSSSSSGPAQTQAQALQAQALELQAERNAKASLEKQLGAQRKQMAEVQKEAESARRLADESQARLAEAEHARTELIRAHADQLARRESEAAERAKVAAAELREQQRLHAAALDEASAARHSLEQRLAHADEASAASAAALAQAQESAALERTHRAAADARLAEKAEALSRVQAESAELSRKLGAALEGEQSARRAEAAANSALEAAQHLNAGLEAQLVDVRTRLEGVRQEAAALHKEKLDKQEALRNQKDDASVARADADDWRRRHDEVSARLEAERAAFDEDRKRMEQQRGQFSEERRQLQIKVRDAQKRADSSSNKVTLCIAQASGSLTALKKVLDSARELEATVEQAKGAVEGLNEKLMASESQVSVGNSDSLPEEEEEEEEASVGPGWGRRRSQSPSAAGSAHASQEQRTMADMSMGGHAMVGMTMVAEGAGGERGGGSDADADDGFAMTQLDPPRPGSGAVGGSGVFVGGSFGGSGGLADGGGSHPRIAAAAVAARALAAQVCEGPSPSIGASSNARPHAGGDALSQSSDGGPTQGGRTFGFGSSSTARPQVLWPVAEVADPQHYGATQRDHASSFDHADEGVRQPDATMASGATCAAALAGEVGGDVPMEAEEATTLQPLEPSTGHQPSARSSQLLFDECAHAGPSGEQMAQTLPGHSDSAAHSHERSSGSASAAPNTQDEGGQRHALLSGGAAEDGGAMANAGAAPGAIEEAGEADERSVDTDEDDDDEPRAAPLVGGSFMDAETLRDEHDPLGEPTELQEDAHEEGEAPHDGGFLGVGATGAGAGAISASASLAPPADGDGDVAMGGGDAAGLNGETLAYGGIDGDEADDRFHDDKENGNNSAPAAVANDMGAETCAYEDDEF